jgi:imidazole glycerol-phosphate synthase subunit HisF
MLRPRIIPCLLVQGGRLVKTVGFGPGKYVGDPLNAVRIFNEKSVDELMVIDIDATAKGTEPDYRLLESLAVESRMPLAYGGGIRSVAQAARIVQLGVEKIAVSSAAIADPSLVGAIAEHLGRQSVVVVLDVRRGADGVARVFTHNGTRATGRGVTDLAREMEAAGAGEIVLNSIDRDGMMQGYDVDLVASVREAVRVPMTALGGAGKFADLEALVRRCGIIGVAAGSYFVFKGVHRAVLISYPDRGRRRDLTAIAQGAVAGSAA